MHRLPRALVVAALLVAPTAATAQLGGSPKASISLAADYTSYAPGDRVRMDVLLAIEPKWHVNSHEPTYDYLIPTVAEVRLPEGWPAAKIDYPPGELEAFAFVDTPISVYSYQVTIASELEIPATWTEPGARVEVSLRYQACNDRTCLPPATAEAALTLDVGERGEATGIVIADTNIDAGTGGAVAGATRGFAAILLLGLAGGLLLNAMPCVLPVLSLKVMGLVKSAGGGRRQVTVAALATAAGILVSFWALAGAAALAKLAGASVGWGVQFQEPVFVVFLTLVVTLFSLNLWGLFEVPLPARLAGWTGGAGGEGLAGHFTTGLFATLLATPCSAPFLGTAVGFGLSQSPLTIFVVFTAVGCGMALPYFALAIAPRAVNVLPKPGPWMDRFRVLMGFFLAAAAVWLLYVLSSQISPERLAFIELSLLALAFFVWLRGTRGGGVRWAGLGVAAALAAALVLAADRDARRPDARLAGDVEVLIDWVRFDRAEAERLRGSGRLVFVDVTADWCFTCKVNERLALETPEVAAAFERAKVVAMKADWTNRDESIGRFLADHGRYGIPFYLLYRPGREPHLFGELITRDGIIAVVEEADGYPSDNRVTTASVNSVVEALPPRSPVRTPSSTSVR